MGIKGHRLVLLGAHRALHRQIEEIERVAVRGQSPGAGRAELTPVPPELWERLRAHVDRLQSAADDMALRVAPRGPHAQNRQPLAATLRWIDRLLDRVAEGMEELEPAALEARCGQFEDPAEADRLAVDVAAMRAETAAMRVLLRESGV